MKNLTFTISHLSVTALFAGKTATEFSMNYSSEFSYGCDGNGSSALTCAITKLLNMGLPKGTFYEDLPGFKEVETMVKETWSHPFDLEVPKQVRAEVTPEMQRVFTFLQ